MTRADASRSQNPRHGPTRQRSPDTSLRRRAFARPVGRTTQPDRGTRLTSPKTSMPSGGSSSRWTVLSSASQLAAKGRELSPGAAAFVAQRPDRDAAESELLDQRHLGGKRLSVVEPGDTRNLA